MSDTNVLAINFNHDGSAAVISNGRLAAYVNTERFSKKKKHPGIREADLDHLGPRALGNRSILADPRNPEMKDILNKKVKFREGFRPFAPSVLNEHAEEWFGLMDSDGTARIQTVTIDDNPNYYRLIERFYQLTGVPVLLNTSFNMKGGPIVETPKDAIDCFLDTEIDMLVFQNRIVQKKDTPSDATVKPFAFSIAP